MAVPMVIWCIDTLERCGGCGMSFEATDAEGLAEDVAPALGTGIHRMARSYGQRRAGTASAGSREFAVETADIELRILWATTSNR